MVHAGRPMRHPDLAVPAIIDNNDVRGLLIGAALGAALGGGIGYALDRQQEEELEQALERERAASAATVQRVQGDRLLVTINDGVAFDPGSVAIRPDFLPTLESVADVLARSDDSRVLVIGHTDAVGPAAYNRQLSTERADAVREALATYGIASSRIRAGGRGEAEPRADNDTVDGRQANRRVEILVTPARTPTLQAGLPFWCRVRSLRFDLNGTLTSAVGSPADLARVAADVVMNPQAVRTLRDQFNLLDQLPAPAAGRARDLIEGVLGGGGDRAKRTPRKGSPSLEDRARGLLEGLGR